jgi:uncharacterized glyoxalase superfamily protein PhnB
VKISKTTPILSVESIEASLPFWTDVLGYTKTVEVPHNGKLGFVILVRDGLEIMLQTQASVRDDLPQIADFFRPGSICLYSDVDSIEVAAKSLKDTQVIVPLRTTPYGAREFWVRNHDGNILGFAEFKK